MLEGFLGSLVYLFTLLGWNATPTAWLLMLPFGSIILLAVVLVGCAFAIILSWYAKKKGYSFWLMLLLAVFLSPIVQAIVFLILLRIDRDADGIARPDIEGMQESHRSDEGEVRLRNESGTLPVGQ
jgi:ABC-type transport system involved in multi-copper enzyme maturation permease subunit